MQGLPSSFYVLSLAAAISATLHIRTDYRGPRWQTYFFKPLTTSLITLIAVQATPPVSPFYKSAIIIGLLCALVGDIFLMLPSDRFLEGLVSFLLTHIAYILAFASQLEWRISTAWALLLLAYVILMGWLLLPHVSRSMRLPVIVYMSAILLVTWAALELWWQTGANFAGWALVGALLFVISDSALALNRFRTSFRSAQLAVLGIYYVAQWCMAVSVAHPKLL